MHPCILAGLRATLRILITLHFLEDWPPHLMIVAPALLEIQSAEFPYGLNSYHSMKQGHLGTLNA